MTWLDESTLRIARELRKPVTKKQYIERLCVLDPEFKKVNQWERACWRGKNC